MNDDELRLNSLSRFSKGSPRLHLEEHSHCEVPAGCGGVILRWHNPATEAPLLIRIYSPGTIELFIDGVAPSSSRPLIARGPHILAVEVRDAPLGGGLIMFAAYYDLKSKDQVDGDVDRAALFSAADGTWFCNVTPAADDVWRLSDQDMSGWNPMVVRPMGVPNREHAWRQWRDYETARRGGAQPIGVPPSGSGRWGQTIAGQFLRFIGRSQNATVNRPMGPVRIRKVFELSARVQP